MLFLKILFFSKKILFLGLIIICIKIVLFISPQTGVNVKQFFNYKNLAEDNFVKTYDTFGTKKYPQYKNFHGLIKVTFLWIGLMFLK